MALGMVLCGLLPAEETAAGLGRPAAVLHAGLDGACEAASADGALVLAAFGSVQSAAFQMWRKNVLESPEFLAEAGPLHVAVLDAAADPKRAAELGISAVPVLVLFSGDGILIARRAQLPESEDLLPWIENGRNRARLGLWLGLETEDARAAAAGAGGTDGHASTDGAGDVVDLVREAVRGPASAELLDRLARALGDPRPADRARAQSALLEEGTRAMPVLIEAAGHPYLGVRIAAAEMLAKLAGETPGIEVNPWSPPEERVQTLKALQAWWSQAEGSFAARATAPDDADLERAASGAVTALVSGGPAARTEAMAALARMGLPALPKVREAVRRAERQGDPKSLAALEDVRWAILVPSKAATQLPGVRRALARGTGPERQAAAEQLGRAGRDALAALSELAQDPDPLVRESALHALSATGDADALQTMSALLAAPDANLRMTAAQDLGHTKREEAAQYLVGLLNDPDEVVACAAIAALEEVHATDQGPALLRCLRDPRWRVRAAAAEVIGKLNIPDSQQALRHLLGDPDAFVVQCALAALGQMDRTPALPELRAVMRRVPAVQAQVIGMILKSDSPYPLQVAMELFGELGAQGQAAILAALSKHENDTNTEDDYWKPLLDKALASTQVETRRQAASLLTKRSTKLGAEFARRLLNDADADVRGRAADAVLRVLAHWWGVIPQNQGPDHGLFSTVAASPRWTSLMAEVERGADEATAGPSPTPAAWSEAALEAPSEPPEEETVENARLKALETRAAELLRLVRAWHLRLRPEAERTADPRILVAAFATGDARTGLPFLLKSLPDDAGPHSTSFENGGPAMALVLRQMPWPEGRAFLEAALKIRPIVELLLNQLQYARPEVLIFVAEPDRLVALLEGTQEKDLGSLLESLLGDPAEYPISLQSTDRDRQEVLRRLSRSGKPALRALAACLYGVRSDADGMARLDAAAADENPWVRHAAIKGLAPKLPDRSALETKLGPFLTDPDDRVVTVAAIGLLLPETRTQAGMDWLYSQFQYESGQAWVRNRAVSRDSGRDRPLAALKTHPDFIEAVRARMAGSPRKGEAAPRSQEEIGVRSRLLEALALLLAQYGDFSGLDFLIEHRAPGRLEVNDSILLAGIGLSREPRFVPELRRMLKAAEQQWEARGILKGLRGMPGDEARELRREINDRIRAMGRPEGIP
ncbi:MAG: HEAT repeat domain-containing protein [Planctomycetes bacterium]|nr:HEAT repeat domain-containing protein [Planctomycetota bacterium]